MTEYTAAKDALLMAAVEHLKSLPHQYEEGTWKELFLAYKAAQSPASAVSPSNEAVEPKPSVVSEKILDIAWDGYHSGHGTRTTGDINQLKAALEAAAPYIRSAELTHTHSLNAGLRLENSGLKIHANILKQKLAAKDADITTVVRDNDAKMAEIKRLKTLVEEYRLEACAETSRANDYVLQLNPRRHPDIKAAAERARQAWFNGKGQSYWEDVARAVLNAPENGQ